MKTLSKVSIVGGLGLVLTLAVVMIYRRWASPPDGKALATCEPGRAETFDVSYRSEVTLEPLAFAGAGGQGMQQTVYSFRGTLVRTCLSVTGTQIALKHEVIFTEFDASTGHGTRPLPPTVTVFEQIDRSSAFHRLNFDNNATPAGRHLLRDLLAKTQFNGGEGPTWHLEETDVQGPYQVDYIQAESSTGLTIEVEKTRYRYLNQSPADASEATIVTVAPDSVALFVFERASRRLQSAELTMGQDVSAGSKQLSQSKTTITWQARGPLRQVVVAADQTKEATLQASPESQDDFAASGHRARMMRSLQEQELGTLGWDDLKNLIQNATAADQTSLFLKLRAYFILHPEGAKLAVAELEGGTVDDDAFRSIALALSKAGHSEAEQALLAAVTAHLGHSKEQAYLIGLVGLAPEPSVALEQALKSLMTQNSDDDVRQAARLAVANVSAIARRERPENFTKNQAEEIERSLAAKDHAAIVNSLHALTNFGGDEILSAIQGRLIDGDPIIRATALSALRFVPVQGAEDALMNALLHDGDSDVKRAAANELTFRQLSPTALASVRTLVREVQEETLVTNLLSVLKNHLKEQPDLKAEFTYFRDNSPILSVRQHAAAILTTI